MSQRKIEMFVYGQYVTQIGMCVIFNLYVRGQYTHIDSKLGTFGIFEFFQ